MQDWVRSTLVSFCHGLSESLVVVICNHVLNSLHVEKLEEARHTKQLEQTQESLLRSSYELVERYDGDQVEEARALQIVNRNLLDVGYDSVRLLVFVLLAKAKDEVKSEQAFDGVIHRVRQHLGRRSERSVVGLHNGVLARGN